MAAPLLKKGPMRLGRLLSERGLDLGTSLGRRLCSPAPSGLPGRAACLLAVCAAWRTARWRGGPSPHPGADRTSGRHTVAERCRSRLGKQQEKRKSRLKGEETSVVEKVLGSLQHHRILCGK